MSDDPRGTIDRKLLGILRGWPLALVLALNGCNGCKSVDYPVSSPPGDPGGAHRTFAQSETSMVRVDQTGDRPEGEPASRFLVGYNDTTSSIADTHSSTCWTFTQERASTDGWASSDDFGGHWARHDQLPVSATLRDHNIHARHGDPWLAAWSSKDPKVPGIVLYVSVAQAGLDRYGPPWFLLLTRSLDNGKSFGDSFVLLGPQGGVPDGPKVAIDGDGTLAVVVWNEPGLALPYRLVWNLDGPLATGATGVVNPVSVANPPNPSCTYSGAIAHPRVAAGRTTFYVAALVDYSCPTGGQQRLEVYRNSAIGLAFGSPWQRILSALPPPSVSGGLGILNAQDAAGTPRFGTRTDRGSSLPDLAVGQGKDGEFLIATDLQIQAGTLPDEATSEKVVLFRVPKSDTCDARNHKGDLDSCGQMLTGQTIDSLAKPGKMETVANRAGIWESKPALFTGKVPDGTADERVGVVWYAQPYKGRMTVTDEMRARTIVEAAVSTDTGLTFSGPFNLTAKSDQKNDNPPVDPDIGVYFHLCQLLCTGYFGEYLSGAFQFNAPGTEAIVATWGDSREGCTDQSATTKHHHVWAGAVRAK
jgi:hypothetical protein